MFKITIIAVGSLKESWWKEAQAEFLRRLSPFAKVDVQEIDAEPFGGAVTAEQSMRLEGARILKRLPADGYVIALERTGKTVSSPEFARLLDEEGGTGTTLVIIVGGAAGLDPAVLAEAGKKVSMSAMTFTHEMARVFLLEQLYRAMTILAGKAYHL
ncbi:MAG TPA: 23S rRNA (pseudouridine(1915)-N(3))-methyltransferase RlmH [Candidatus Eisenbacteria bacterium]|jgi:23S rRNA (pseudouridine1915-N3)-methyltransferase|nr:23S rRNA (pseudouridine(1915)-N(3))-methyltransferase RlmH [Candidatus Eisenbacteria bacterium]